MENIYFNCLLTKRIVVESKYLDENIDNYIEKYIKRKTEGLCIDEGYVQPETVKILKRGVGVLYGSRFTGDITYEIAYSAEVCNPMVGNIIECKVKFINKLGVLGNNGPITIIVGKQFHENSNDLDKIKVGDIVKVEVIAKKFYLNDKEIKIIAKIWNENQDNSKKSVKKEFISSDLTPINNENENEYLENDIIYGEDDGNKDEIDEPDEMEEMEEMDEFNELEDSDEEEDDKDIKLENPDEVNLDLNDLEIDEDYDENSDDDDSSVNDDE